MKRFFSTLLVILFLVVFSEVSKAVVLTISGAQANVVAFDATTGQPDATTKAVQQIVIVNDAASTGYLTVTVTDNVGNVMYASGREPTVPPGLALTIRWVQHGIWKVTVSTSSDAKVWVCPATKD